MIGGVDLTIEFDVSDIKRLLTDAEREVFTDYETVTRDFYQDAWIGWKYADRPPGAPRLVSHDAWTTDVVTTEAGPVLRVENKARDWRKGAPYVSHVARSKGQPPEWRVVTEAFTDQVLPSLARDLEAAIAATLNEPRPRGVRPAGSGPSETLDLEI